MKRFCLPFHFHVTAKIKQLCVLLILGLLFSFLPVATTNAAALPPAQKVALHNTSGGVKITWGNVSHAYQYEVYRSTNGGGFQKVATLKKQNAWQYTDKKTKNAEGNTYSYYIKAIAKKNVYTPSTSETKTIVRICPIKKLKLKNIPKGVIIQCSWEDHKNIDGYEIKVAADGLKTFIVRRAGRSTTIKLVKIYSGKTYRIQARPYKKVGNTTYFGNWCNSKKIRARYML